MNFLRLPLDFERRPEVRLFARKLAAANRDCAIEWGTWTAVRVWFDWATACSDWRALRHAGKVEGLSDTQGAWSGYHWEKEDLTFVVESACQWTNGEGVLMAAGVESGLFVMEQRENTWGVVLKDFFPLNEHLSPAYKTMQQKGGQARAAKVQREQDERLAAQQLEIHGRQGVLPFGTMVLSKEEEQACYALVIRMFRACGLAVTGIVYSQDIMSAALEVLRCTDQADVDLVENYLVDRRGEPRVVKQPLRVLRLFSDYLNDAREVA